MKSLNFHLPNANKQFQAKQVEHEHESLNLLACPELFAIPSFLRFTVNVLRAFSVGRSVVVVGGLFIDNRCERAFGKAPKDLPSPTLRASDK